MYHFAQCTRLPSSISGRTSDWTQVPTGVCAFQEETSSSNGNESVYVGDVQVP